VHACMRVALFGAESRRGTAGEERPVEGSLGVRWEANLDARGALEALEADGADARGDDRRDDSSEGERKDDEHNREEVHADDDSHGAAPVQPVR